MHGFFAGEVRYTADNGSGHAPRMLEGLMFKKEVTGQKLNVLKTGINLVFVGSTEYFNLLFKDQTGGTTI